MFWALVVDHYGVGVKWSFYPESDYDIGLSDIVILVARGAKEVAIGEVPVSSRELSAKFSSAGEFSLCVDGSTATMSAHVVMSRKTRGLALGTIC